MAKIRPYTCYLFDLDGTLIDTVDLIYRCFAFSLGKFAGITVSKQDVLAHIGLPLRDQFRLYFPNRPDEFIESVMNTHMEYQLLIYPQHVRLFPEAGETVRGLRLQRKLLGVVTSRRMATIELYLKHVGIYECFDTFVTPESTERHKPHPDPVLKALEILKCSPTEALFVGDASFDIESGSAAGVDTAFVGWSESDLSKLKVQPTCVVDSMRDLLGA